MVRSSRRSRGLGESRSAVGRLPAWGRGGRGRGGEGPADSLGEDRRPVPGSVGSVVRPVGRAALWLFVCLVLARGLGDILASPKTGRAPAVVAPARVWPDDGARAFAVEFARAYVGWRPGEEASRRRRLAGMVVPELRDRVAGEVPRRGDGVTVAQATVAGTRRLAGDRALVTVACALASGATRNLVVPLARDARGGLAVHELPSFGARSRLARVTANTPEPLPSGDVDALSRLSEAFLGAYVSGEVERLSYLVAPGARVGAIGELRLVDVVGVARLGLSGGGRTTLLVEARVRDRLGGAVYATAFRLEVVRRDRWYVTRVAGGGER